MADGTQVLFEDSLHTTFARGIALCIHACVPLAGEEESGAGQGTTRGGAQLAPGTAFPGHLHPTFK